jgi:hypothetical protein
MRRASRPVEIVPLIQSQLRQCGLYTRERWPLESTEFSLTRFLVPSLSDTDCHDTSVFMDCDMLCLCDIWELSADYPVSVVKHDYTPRNKTKFLGQEQTQYPRKNWSSLMVFDTECWWHALTPEYVNTAPALDLHRFAWAKNEEIGSLEPEYNWLVGEYGKIRDPKILHFTNGGPWFPDYANCDYADWWREEARHAGLLNG